MFYFPLKKIYCAQKIFIPWNFLHYDLWLFKHLWHFSHLSFLTLSVPKINSNFVSIRAEKIFKIKPVSSCIYVKCEKSISTNLLIPLPLPARLFSLWLPHNGKWFTFTLLPKKKREKYVWRYEIFSFIIINSWHNRISTSC